MDVAKYIGLFLLKNNYVYVHGLGNLELRKKAASYDGEVLEGPSYEVVMTPMGSIDDNLANFIATNEQISISKASNALREFSTHSRTELQAGKTVNIPSIGNFIEEGGRIKFLADKNFQYTPPSIASIKVAKRNDDIPYTTSADVPPTKPRYIDPDTEVENTPISWIKITAWGLGLIVLCGAIYLGVRYMMGQNNTNEVPLIHPQLHTDTTKKTAAPAPIIVDSTLNLNHKTDSAQSVKAPTGQLLNFDVVLNTYTELGKAQKRVEKLVSYGNKVQLVAEDDSSLFYVILPVQKVSAADTAKLLDSLKRVFNPTYGVKVFE